MDVPFLLRGFGLGFSIAAVFGPIGLLCLRRTLAGGFAIGFASGLGAATADATYAAIAGFGISVLAAALVEQRVWLQLIGGAFLVLIGLRTSRAAPASQTAREVPGGGSRLASAYSSTLALTLSNPMTILSFGAIFAGLGLGGVAGTSTTAAAALVVGVFLGSAGWWLVLAGAGSRLRSRVTPRRLRWVNRVSGLLILAFGVQSLASVLLDSRKLL